MRPVYLNQTEISGYKILERVGIGGMGEVYKAFHPGLNRVAAIKFLFQKEHADRFKNEAYIQSSVNHPNIARLYEYTTSGGIPCIIMEYVEGLPLDSYIIKNGRINSEEIEKILMQIASALKYLHGKNILHRDIKPQNFKIENDGTVKMLDFGISKSEYTPKLTQMGFVVGTTEYMAPEQFEHKVEMKSDIWSLGVMTYEMLTGGLPFESNNPITLRSQIIKAKFTDPKILVPQISEKLSELINRSLRINPASRASAEEIEQLLKGKIAAEKKIASNPSIKIPVKPKWIYAGVALIILIALSLFFSQRNSSTAIIPPSGDTVVHTGNETNTGDGKISIVKIFVNNTQNAIIVFPDGSHKSLPIELNDKLGVKYDAVIRADGYNDKPVHVAFLPTEGVYTYSLDKKSE